MKDISNLIERLEKEAECAAYTNPGWAPTQVLILEAATALRGLTTLRPMADAPKDGTWIMLPQNPMHVGVWQYPAWCLIRWWTETRADRSNAYDGWHGADGLPMTVSDESKWAPLTATQGAPE